MVKLKLQRIGRKKTPHFRIIVQESSKDPWDKTNEILGWINPRSKEKDIKKERVEYWLSVGAQPTDTVRNLLINEGIIKGDKAKTVKISKKRAEKIAKKNSIEEEPKEEIKDEKTEEVKTEKEATPKPKDKTETTEEEKPTPANQDKKEETKKEPPAEEVKEEKAKETSEEEK